jgi:hypothetical protein
MLLAVDVAFFVFHTALIVFNMVGWAFQRTRKWHLVSLGLTAGSWFVAGYWKGWGYCFCTDWHFQVRQARGFQEYDANYIQLLARVAADQNWSVSFAESLALTTFAVIIVCTAVANWPRRKAAGVSNRARPIPRRR